MAYIDAELLKKHGFVLAKVKTDKDGEVTEFMTLQVDDAPTADVVPKSEVERLEAQNSNLDILVKDLRFRNKELIAFNRRWAKECADLQEECDQIKDKVAREIFEEMQSCLIQRHWNGLDIVTFEFDAVKYAELKKKYTEGEYDEQV